MKAIIEFVKTTLVGGFLFLVPVVLAVILVGKALQLSGQVLAPASRLIPGEPRD